MMGGIRVVPEENFSLIGVFPRRARWIWVDLQRRAVKKD